MNTILGRTTVIPTDNEMVFVAMNGEHTRTTQSTVHGVRVTSWTYQGWLFCRSEEGNNLALRADIDSKLVYPFDREE